MCCRFEPYGPDVSNDLEYMRVYMLERWNKRRAEAIAFMGGVCCTPGCGERNDLQFDHVDRKWKRYSISSVPSAAEHRFWSELMACQLLCPPCHRVKTSEEMGVPHGGGVSGKKNCLCDPCRLKKNEYLRAYRKANPRRRTAGMV